jgi:hypothetical protein
MLNITLEDLIKHVEEAHKSAYSIGYRDGYVSGKSSCSNSNHITNNDNHHSLGYFIENLKEKYDPKK